MHTLDINLHSHIVPTSSMVCVSCLFRSASARNSCNGTLRLWAWISAHRHTYRGQHWVSYMHGGTFSASPVPRQQLGGGETRLCLGMRLVKVEPLLKETWERGLKSGRFPLRGDPLVSNYITHNVSTCDQKMEAEMKADQETLKQPFT